MKATHHENPAGLAYPVAHGHGRPVRALQSE